MGVIWSGLLENGFDYLESKLRNTALTEHLSTETSKVIQYVVEKAAWKFRHTPFTNSKVFLDKPLLFYRKNESNRDLQDTRICNTF